MFLFTDGYIKFASAIWCDICGNTMNYQLQINYE